MNSDDLILIFRTQMIALGAFSILALLAQTALARLAESRMRPNSSALNSTPGNAAFQLAGALFCLLNIGFAVFRYHFGPAPASSGWMAIKMLFNAGVMGALAIGGYWLFRRAGFVRPRTAHALLAGSVQSAALVFFDLISAAFWFWRFIQGV